VHPLISRPSGCFLLGVLREPTLAIDSSMEGLTSSVKVEEFDDQNVSTAAGLAVKEVGVHTRFQDALIVLPFRSICRG
jgi:hypothetical protein